MREVESLIEESKKAIADDDEDDSDAIESVEEDEEAEDSANR